MSVKFASRGWSMKKKPFCRIGLSPTSAAPRQYFIEEIWLYDP